VARAATATPPPNRVTFNRLELNRILNLYGAWSRWRVADYAIGLSERRARVFGIPPRPRGSIYRIEKDPRAGAQAGHVQRDLGDRPHPAPRHELERVLLVIDRKLALV